LVVRSFQANHRAETAPRPLEAPVMPQREGSIVKL
jgi:hypothetical protein